MDFERKLNMVKQVTRKEAKEIIAGKEYNTLTDFQKIEIIESCYPPLDDDWTFEEYYHDDEVFNKYSTEIKQLVESEEHIKLPFKDSLKPIILDLFITQFYGVANTFLESLISKNLQVTGENDRNGKCPCCDYLSIGYGEDGAWEICSVCFWENGGDGPNHMKLADARLNFKKHGAMDKGSLKFIDPNAIKKFPRQLE